MAFVSKGWVICRIMPLFAMGARVTGVDAERVKLRG